MPFFGDFRGRGLLKYIHFQTIWVCANWYFGLVKAHFLNPLKSACSFVRWGGSEYANFLEFGTFLRHHTTCKHVFFFPPYVRAPHVFLFSVKNTSSDDIRDYCIQMLRNTRQHQHQQHHIILLPYTMVSPFPRWPVAWKLYTYTTILNFRLFFYQLHTTGLRPLNAIVAFVLSDRDRFVIILILQRSIFFLNFFFHVRVTRSEEEISRRSILANFARSVPKPVPIWSHKAFVGPPSRYITLYMLDDIVWTSFWIIFSSKQ